MPVTSNVLKALSFLGLAWSAQVAIAALPSASPELPRPAAPAITIIAAPPATVPPAPAPEQAAPAPLPAVPVIAAAAPDARQVECMAKVILHEAGAQGGTGQIAVAQVIRARVRTGRFGADVCGVVRQRGQFFDVDAYDPPRASAAWGHAVAVATDTLNEVGEEVAPGALFFHAASATRGMGTHVRVAQIGGNVFYR